MVKHESICSLLLKLGRAERMFTRCCECVLKLSFDQVVVPD